MITLNDILTSSNTYPERLNSPELTDEVRANSMILLEKVNALIKDLGITSCKVSSGFRTGAANSNAGGAKKSTHMLGVALDILDDKEQSLAKKIEEDYNTNKENSLLVKHGLYMESPKHTIGHYTNWVHLQTRHTINRIFIP